MSDNNIYKVSVNDLYEDAVKPYLNDIFQLRMNSKSVEDVCDYLKKVSKVNIPEIIFLSMIQDKPELRETWYKGNYVLIQELESSMLKIAKGFTLEDTEEYYKPDKDGNLVLVGKKVKKKAIPPDSKILMRYLEVHNNEIWDNDTKEVNEIKIEFSEEIKDFSE